MDSYKKNALSETTIKEIEQYILQFLDIEKKDANPEDFSNIDSLLMNQIRALIVSYFILSNTLADTKQADDFLFYVFAKIRTACVEQKLNVKSCCFESYEHFEKWAYEFLV